MIDIDSIDWNDFEVGEVILTSQPIGQRCDICYSSIYRVQKARVTKGKRLKFYSGYCIFYPCKHYSNKKGRDP